MDEYDTLDDSSKNNNSYRKKICNTNDDFPSIFMDLFRAINWKVAIFLFIISIFIHSDIFIETFLRIDQIDGDTPNDSGTITQVTAIVVAYIILDILVKGEFI